MKLQNVVADTTAGCIIAIAAQPEHLLSHRAVIALNVSALRQQSSIALLVPECRVGLGCVRRSFAGDAGSSRPKRPDDIFGRDRDSLTLSPTSFILNSNGRSNGFRRIDISRYESIG